MKARLVGSAVVVVAIVAASARWGGALGSRQAVWPPTFGISVLSRTATPPQSGLTIEVLSRARYPALLAVWVEGDSGAFLPGTELRLSVGPRARSSLVLPLAAQAVSGSMTVNVREVIAYLDSRSFEPDRVAPVWKCRLRAGAALECEP